jgi:biopolymer transport protein ExbD
MKLPRNAKIFRGQLDAAPFASVAFLLMLFLVLQTRLVFTPGVRIDLPQVTESLPGTLNPTVVVAIDRSGLLYYQNQRTTLEGLRTSLRAEVRRSREPLTLEVRADQAVTLESAVPLLSLASDVGMRDAKIVTRSRAEPIFHSTRR